MFAARPAFTFPSKTTQDELSGSLVDAPFLHPTAGVIPRFLQSSSGNASTDSGGAASPDVVCESLNEQLKGEMTCTCDRYGKRGVSVSCNAVVDTCNEDNTYCVRLSTQYYTDEKGVPIVMTSCTNLTTPGLVDRADSCVQVFPAEAGNFTTVTKCYATLNDQSCGCSVCDSSVAAAEDRATGDGGAAAGVSVDCCRIMDGAKATCLPVLSTGPVAVQYDQVTDEQQCKATSSGERIRGSGLAAAVALLLSATSMW